VSAVSLRSRAAAAVAVLALVLVSAGCSGDDEPAASSESADAVTTLVDSGLASLTAGDASAAKVTFENVLDLDPDNLYAHYNLGLIAQQSGDDRAAITSYDAALEADPDYAPALYNKAILTEATDLDAAVELYRKAVEADPELAAAYMRLGFALVHLGQTDEGSEFLEEGIQLDPTMVDVKAPSYD
jgi:Tfp pilus assembly protein PilF